MLVDSDILIDFTNGENAAVDWLDAANKISTLRVSVVTFFELLVGSRNKNHLREIELLFRRFEVIHINEQISVTAEALIIKYFLSHGLLIADALIAATALFTDEELATKNKRDFRFIEGLRLVDYP